MAPNPHQMENSGFELDKSLELKGIKTISNQVSTTHIQQENKSEMQKPNSCNMAACRNLHEQYLKDKSKMTTSPWDHLKSVFLVSIIVLLFIWILVYVVFTWLNLL